MGLTLLLLGSSGCDRLEGAVVIHLLKLAQRMCINVPVSIAEFLAYAATVSQSATSRAIDPSTPARRVALPPTPDNSSCKNRCSPAQSLYKPRRARHQEPPTPADKNGHSMQSRALWPYAPTHTSDVQRRLQVRWLKENWRLRRLRAARAGWGLKWDSTKSISSVCTPFTSALYSNSRHTGREVIQVENDNSSSERYPPASPGRNDCAPVDGIAHCEAYLWQNPPQEQQRQRSPQSSSRSCQHRDNCPDRSRQQGRTREHGERRHRCHSCSRDNVGL